MARRSRFAQRETKSNHYGLVGIRKGSLIAFCVDKYRRWELGIRTGVILRRASHTVWIQWDDTGETEALDDGDVRYWVDTNRARITAPPGQTILDAKKE